MTDDMAPFWIANLIVWLALMAYASPGAWSAVFGKHTRIGDPARLSVVTTSFVMAGFSLRWLIAPQNIFVWQVLNVLSIADAVYIFFMIRAYGRGRIL